MKKILTLCSFTVLLLAFAGCSKDDDDAIDSALLIGTWQQTQIYDGELDQWYAETDVLVLHADGSGYEALSLTATPSKDDRFTWHCNGNTLVLDFGGGDIGESSVEKLTDTELVLAGTYEGEDGGHYTDRAFYQRVN